MTYLYSEHFIGKVCVLQFSRIFSVSLLFVSYIDFSLPFCCFLLNFFNESAKSSGLYTGGRWFSYMHQNKIFNLKLRN